MDLGAPRFSLSLDGRSLTQLSLPHVISVELSESMERLDALTLRLAIPEEVRQLQSVLRLGQPFEATLGYGAETVRHVSGDIVEITYSYNTSDVCMATLKGLDRLHRLKQNTQSRHWSVPHDVIVRDIAKQHNLEAVVEGVEAGPLYEFQAGISDAAFLMGLARRHHYYIRVQDDCLYFGRQTRPIQALRLRWGEGLIDFQVTQSLAEMPTRVMVSGWNYERNQAVRGSSEARHLARYSGGTLGVEFAQRRFGENLVEISNSELKTDAACQAAAVAEHQRRADGFVRGQVTARGLPEAMSNRRVYLAGVGARSGWYLIRETTHSLDSGSGYRTRLAVCSDSLCKGEG